MDRFGKLTQQLESTVGRLLGTQAGDGSEPLELLTGILRDVESRIEPVGRGRRRFPYTQIELLVLAPQKEDQDRCATVLEDLESKLRERLAELACEPPARLDVTLQFARKPRKHWTGSQRVELIFSRDEPSASGAPAHAPGALATRQASASTSTRGAGAAGRGADAAVATPPSVRITVLRGASARRSYTLQQTAIRFGRGSEHAEASGRTRHNDIAFLDDEDEVNRTVARAQAHLRFQADRGELRLFDDGSSNGTRIVRNAEIITVTPHGPRGVRLQSGDIIELGRARVKIEYEA